MLIVKFLLYLKHVKTNKCYPILFSFVDHVLVYNVIDNNVIYLIYCNYLKWHKLLFTTRYNSVAFVYHYRILYNYRLSALTSFMRMLHPPWPLCASLRDISESATHTLSPSWGTRFFSRTALIRPVRGRVGFGAISGFRVVDTFFIGVSRVKMHNILVESTVFTFTTLQVCICLSRRLYSGNALTVVDMRCRMSLCVYSASK